MNQFRVILYLVIKKMAKKKKELIKKEIIKKEEKFDVIVPLLEPNPDYFYENVDIWFKEIPINRLIFGCNLKFEEVEKLARQYPEIEIIDQTSIISAGKCLAELMKLVKTKWFVYIHADARPTPHCFEVLKREQANDVGIIESNRVIWDGKKTTYPNFIKVKRAYAGFQLFQKKAIEDIIYRIEDDYIFRSEDLIFQQAIEKAGYKYIKSWGMHIHEADTLQLNNNYQTQGKKRINECMFKSYIKYAEPEGNFIPWCLISLTNYIRDYRMDVYDFYTNFCMKYNKEWSKIILNNLTGGISNDQLEKDVKNQNEDL